MFLGLPGPGDSVTIILQDIGHEDVERVLEFVYTGAAMVPGHKMDGFVTAAGALGIGPLLDPRRHLEMSTVQPAHPCTPDANVYERHVVPLPTANSRPRQLPRTTGILTPSPWAQNSRPPCAAPKYSAHRPATLDHAPVTTPVTAVPTSTANAVEVSVTDIII